MAETKLKFNDQQKRAIIFGNGPVLIVAGAGTGKTMVITQRIAHLILDKKVNTDAILALTFTEKAAMEMEERVDRLLPYGYVDLWILTFHSFCQKILQQHALDIGISNDFKLLNQTSQWLLVKNNLDKFELDYYKPLGNQTKFIHALIKHFSRAKDEEIYPEQYLEYAQKLKEDADSVTSDELLGQEALRIKEISDAYHVYQQLLLDNNYLDFGDLINYTIKLFKKRPAILKKYQDQFEYVLLDEFQDTNFAQYELVKLLAGKDQNLTVVGDDDQSIYRFRGASMSNIMLFKKDFPKSQEIVLTQNYRSNQGILDLSYNFIQLNNPNRLECQLNDSKKSKGIKFKSKIDKRLIANKKGKAIIEHIHEKNLDLEVETIIKRIVELKQKDKDMTWDDFAILVRANDSATPFTTYLRRTNIPFQFYAMRGLYGKPIILDTLAYFKLLDNYHESEAVFRVLSSPILNIPQTDIVKICHFANKKTKSLYEVLKEISVLKNIEEDTINQINYLVSLIEKHSLMVKEKNICEIFQAFIEDTKYLEKLLKKDEYESNQAISFINQFYKKIKKFEESVDDPKLKVFMQEMELEIESGEQGGLSLDLDIGPQMLKIMTIHAAKGLEFEHVFIPNLVDRRFPTSERKDPILLPDALIKETIPEGDIHIEEERRLFYVAMTRAKTGLYLTSATDYGGARPKKLSRFLEELAQTNKDFKLDKNAEDKAITLATQKVEKVKDDLENKHELPKRFSYSQLAAFASCPYQYKLSFIVKIPRFGKGVFSYGKTLHNTLEEFYTTIINKQGSAQGDLFSTKKDGKLESKKIGELIGHGELVEIFDSNWLDEWYESKEQKQKYYNQAQKSLKEYYNQVKDMKCNTESVEKAFNLKINDYTLRGVIDRIDKLKDGSVNIIDYKTGQAKESEKIKSEDKVQLIIYQIAAEEVFKYKVNSLIYYYLDNNSQVEFIASEKEIEKVKKDIEEKIIKINESKFQATPGWSCKFCDFCNICDFKV